LAPTEFFHGQAGSLSHGRAVVTDLQVCQSQADRQ